jgi:hypothetical protein
MILDFVYHLSLEIDYAQNKSFTLCVIPSLSKLWMKLRCNYTPIKEKQMYNASSSIFPFILPCARVTLDVVLDRKLDLLTTLRHDTWLHLIVAPSLISTLHKSLQHMLSLFSVLCLHPSLPGNGSNISYSSASVLKSSLNGGSLTTDQILNMSCI